MVGSKESIAEGVCTYPQSACTQSASSLFTYSSPPQMLQGYSGRLRKHRHKTLKPRGIHDYYNLMWDPHVRRGNTAAGKVIQSSENVSDNNKSGRNVQPSTGRTKRSITGTNTPAQGLHSRKKQVRIGTPPPIKGRFHNTVQTEVFLEDLSQLSQVLEVDKVVQTDLLHPEIEPLFPVRLKTGVDASTQILPGELVDFDEQVQPIVATLVAKALEQGFLETMEEEELAALKEQQNRFQEKKREEERQLRLLQEQHTRINLEKELLKKHLTERKLVDGESSTSTGGANALGGAYSTAYLLELLPSVLHSLRQEGLLCDAVGNGTLSPPTPTKSPSIGRDHPNGDQSTAASSQEIPESQDSLTGTDSDVPRDTQSDEPWAALETLEKELSQESKEDGS